MQQAFFIAERRFLSFHNPGRRNILLSEFACLCIRTVLLSKASAVVNTRLSKC